MNYRIENPSADFGRMSPCSLEPQPEMGIAKVRRPSTGDGCLEEAHGGSI
jgi:hypothetical protein